MTRDMQESPAFRRGEERQHIRCFADQPERGSLIPWPDGVRRPGQVGEAS